MYLDIVYLSADVDVSCLLYLVVIPQPALQEEDSSFASEGIGSEDVYSSEPVSESDGMSDSGNPLTPDIAVRIVSFELIP